MPRLACLACALSAVGPWTLGALCFARYSVVPICDGPDASLNKLARAELDALGQNLRFAKGRWYLDCNGSVTIHALRQVRHVRSIRHVVLCTDTFKADDSAELAQSLDAAADWSAAVEDLRPLSWPRSCCVVCRRFRELAALLGHERARHLHRELACCLQRRFGWRALGRGSGSI